MVLRNGWASFTGIARVLLSFAIVLGIGAMGRANDDSERRSSPSVAIVPNPVRVEVGRGTLQLNSGSRIGIGSDDGELRGIAGQLAVDLSREFGLAVPVIGKSGGGDPEGVEIRLLVGRGSGRELGREGYTLTAREETKRIDIEASSFPGLFYGAQTFRQLLAPSVRGKARFPEVKIVDNPRYRWRGMHLDVGRHFMPIEFIKRYLDLLAYHKMNVFHWHLTEDQGWRIQIGRYPKLTEVGAWREQEGQRYGGFYTREEVREVVAYAARRFITVVPEIEMPGHSLAALAAYPELSCTGGPFEVGVRWGVYDDVYCAGNEKVFEFLENVLLEIFDLFPGPYLHIGGDECPKARWGECVKCQARIEAEGLADEHELQSYFIKRMSKFLAAHDKKLLGWDEILEGGLAEGATVMSWRGIGPGIEAARGGHDVVMSPTSHCYFDYKQSWAEEEPGAFAVIDLETVYRYEPTPEGLTPEEGARILGAQGNVWTERIPTPRDVEFMAVSRMCALAEVVWSHPERRNYADFLERFSSHTARLDRRNVFYRVPMPIGFGGRSVFVQGGLDVDVRSPIRDAVVRYTLDGSEPTETSPTVDGAIRVDTSVVLSAKTFLPGGRSSLSRRAVYSKEEYRPSISEAKARPGLRLRLARGPFRSLPGFPASGSFSESVADRIGLLPEHPPVDFALEYTGLIRVPRDGVFTFWIASDDGSAFEIAGEALLDNGGLHARREIGAQIALAAGLHPLRVTFFQAGGAKSLQVSWAGPGIEKSEVPAEALFHRPRSRD